MLSPEILSEMKRLLERNERFALATLIDVRGSTPQKAGARILVRLDGTTVGTLGGGCIEAEAVESARAALRDGGAVHGDLGALHEDALAVVMHASAASTPAIEQTNGATYFVEPISPPT